MDRLHGNPALVSAALTAIEILFICCLLWAFPSHLSSSSSLTPSQESGQSDAASEDEATFGKTSASMDAYMGQKVQLLQKENTKLRRRVRFPTWFAPFGHNPPWHVYARTYNGAGGQARRGGGCTPVLAMHSVTAAPLSTPYLLLGPFFGIRDFCRVAS